MKSNLLECKSGDVAFRIFLIGAILVSIYSIIAYKQPLLLGLPFLAIYTVFLVLAKTEYGTLGKRLAKRKIGKELLLVGLILSILGATAHFNLLG